MSDVVIIGVGFAGLFAANMLSLKGLKVKVLYKGFGATTLSSGRFCVLDTVAKKNEISLEKKYNKLKDNHPYKVLSQGSFTKFINLLERATKEMNMLLKNMFQGNPKKSKKVVYQSGAILETSLILDTMKGAIISEKDEKILLLGLEGLYEFNPDLVKKIMKTNMEKLGLKEIEIVTDVVPRKEISKYTSSVLGESSIDETSLTKIVFERFQRCDCKVLIPPILSYTIARRLFEESSGQISELPAEPKFAVGKRIVEKFIEESLKNNVDLKHIEEVKIQTRDNGIVVKYTSLGKHYEIQPNYLIIASGGLIGGGVKVKRKGDIIEYFDTVLGQKIAIGEIGDRRIPYFHSETTRIFNAGYAINEKSQPLNSKMHVFHDRIFAAGSVIGGKSFEDEGTGLGLPLISAYKVVEEIVKEW